MHLDTVSEKTLETLKRLMSDEKLSDFVLVGGTALALQLGHRMSSDLDLFSVKEFDPSSLANYMASKFGFRLPSFSDIGLFGFIKNLKIDLVYYKNGFLQEPITLDGIRMARIEDIAVMKLEAIANVRNRAKDYTDIAFLSEHLSLEEMLTRFKEKFGLDEMFALRSLTVFSEVKKTDEVFLMKEKFDWNKVKKRIIEMTRYPSKRFSPI